MDKQRICLVGVSRIIPTKDGDEDLVAAFYSVVIPRLLGEVERNGLPSRLLGFRTPAGAGFFWQFLGVEVGALDALPLGMTGLVLGETRGEVVGAGNVKQCFDLDWIWQDTAASHCVGEFVAAIPGHVPGLSAFAMTTNAYIGAENALSAEDGIELVNYDTSWPRQFDEMAGRLRGILPPGAVRIAHYGSTSVPGMPAKPVIDLLVEAPSFDAARRCLIPALNRVTWEYWWYGDHMIFIKRERLNGARTHHVHVAPPGHRLWEGLAFRDYLVAHPETAREYAAVKQELATRFRNDREKYTEAKTTFIRAVTDTALSERG